jgi:metal-sulfur cluster biosynthetic enzyme
MGETDVTVAGAEKVKAEVAVTAPPAVVTTTLTGDALADLAGVVTVTDVSVRLTIDCAGVPPNVTPEVVERPAPEIVTD